MEASPLVGTLETGKNGRIFPPRFRLHHLTGLFNAKETRVTVVTNGKDHIYKTSILRYRCPGFAAARWPFGTSRKLPTDINAGTAAVWARAPPLATSSTAVANHDRRILISDFIPYGVGLLGEQAGYGKVGGTA
jgi:hypothetical protein